MLLEVKYKDQAISIVLNKIIGVSDCGNDGVIKCHIFSVGDSDGFSCTEPYHEVCARLYAALDNAEAQKHLTTSASQNTAGVFDDCR
jgi:hypothetical protein